MGGRTINEYVSMMLKKNIALLTPFEKEFARFIKEEKCFIQLHRNYFNKMKIKSQSYLLPDNSKIELGEIEWKGPELLFDSTLIGREQGSLHQLVLDSLHKTDQNMISDLTQNIVLAGGTALMKGIDKRLLHELTEADEDIGREANID